MSKEVYHARHYGKIEISKISVFSFNKYWVKESMFDKTVPRLTDYKSYHETYEEALAYSEKMQEKKFSTPCFLF